MPRFLYALGCTMYVVGAVRHLGEPDLMAEFGDKYVQYMRSVPRFVPFLS